VTLPAEYITQLEQKARRYSGAYTGTCGSLAAGVLHTITEMRRMTETIDQLERDNQALRAAVESRLAGKAAPQCVQAADPGLMEAAWAGVRERHAQLHENIREHAPQHSPAAANASTVAEQLLLDALEAVRDRRQKYGPPLEHFQRTVGMINALFAHKLREPITPDEWAQIMILDKLSREREKPVRDNQVDCCGYAACWAETIAAAGH
jgi:hypothetical protein